VGGVAFLQSHPQRPVEQQRCVESDEPVPCRTLMQLVQPLQQAEGRRRVGGRRRHRWRPRGVAEVSAMLTPRYGIRNRILSRSHGNHTATTSGLLQLECRVAELVRVQTLNSQEFSYETIQLQ